MTGGSSNSNKPAVFKESFKYQKACPEKEHAQKKKKNSTESSSNSPEQLIQFIPQHEIILWKMIIIII